MTDGERIAYNNGFIIGMVSKGVIRVNPSVPGGEVLPWFDNGVLGSDTGLGNILFYKQENGLDNRATYPVDKYILLDYNGTASWYLAFMGSEANMPKNIYNKIKVHYTLDSFPIELYHPLIGLSNVLDPTSIDTPQFSYRTLLPTANTINVATLDLTDYNFSPTNMGLYIGGGCGNLKIYKIELEKYS